MTLDSLERLADDDLRAVVARAESLLKQHDTERKEKAMADARATLAAVGLSLRDLGKGKGKPGKPPLYKGGRSYQHPSDKTLVWAAKGKKPHWLSELEAEGKRAIEIVSEPANDNVPPPVKKAG